MEAHRSGTFICESAAARAKGCEERDDQHGNGLKQRLARLEVAKNSMQCAGRLGIPGRLGAAAHATNVEEVEVERREQRREDRIAAPSTYVQ